MLVRRPYKQSSNPFSNWRWVLEDSDGVVLAWTSRLGGGFEIALNDGTRWHCRSGWIVGRWWFKVVNPRNGEALLETRWGHRVDEPIKFRGHDLCYSITSIAGWGEPPRWRVTRRGEEGDNIFGRELTIMDGRAAALKLTTVRAHRLPDLGRAVIEEDFLGPDTPLIATVGFILFDRANPKGGGG
jgi:hypothetical protein